MERSVFTRIPFDVDFETIKEHLKIRNNKSILNRLIDLIAQANEVAKPKAILLEAPIEKRGDDFIVLGGYSFESEVLCKNIGNVKIVFPYVMTCGNEIEDLGKDNEDLLDQFILDGIKTEILMATTDYISGKIKEKFGYNGINYEIPGSLEGWDIKDQVKLFNLIGGVEDAIGVTLSDSCIMYPPKTVSGIYYESTQTFSNS